MDRVMVKTENLGKQFYNFWAVRDLNLNLTRGEIYGFLGPNGAGKTTTILMILSIIPPTTGKIFLLGERINGKNNELHRRIGVVSEKQYVYPDMTMEEYLDFFGELYRVSNRRQRIGELAERIGLAGLLHRKIGTFSRGMQQRLGFVRALLHDPELLILDEPVSGLDPMGIHQVRGLIEVENRRGKTILISSHLLSEMEKLCDRVAIMNNGQLLAEDRMENLAQRLTEEMTLEIELAEVKHEIIETLQRFEFVTHVSGEGRILNVKVRTDRDYRPDVIQALISCGQTPLGIQARSMNLEEAFMTITKENISLLARNKP